MRIVLAAVAAATALVLSPAVHALQSESRGTSLERAFVPNGKISMDLSAGEYRISGTADNRITLAWDVRDAWRLSEVKACADVQGTSARIVTDGPSNNFRVTMQVPARADLYIRLTAGELRLDGVEGSKDVELHAGEIHIDVNRAEDYRSVDASVWAGEIHAEPFHVLKEGLFRSFDWKGNGPYRLHTKLKAGEVWLSSRAATKS